MSWERRLSIVLSKSRATAPGPGTHRAGLSCVSAVVTCFGSIPLRYTGDGLDAPTHVGMRRQAAARNRLIALSAGGGAILFTSERVFSKCALHAAGR